MRDETTLVLPGEWSADPLPRRPDHATPVPGIPAPDPAAPTALAAVYAERPELRAAALANPETDPDLAAADPDSPLGAAITAHVFHHADRTDEDRERRGRLAAVLADAWLAAHGPVFAAEATVSLFDLRDAHDYHGSRDTVDGVERQYDGGLYFAHDGGVTLSTLYRVREFLAGAPADTYTEVVDALHRLQADAEGMRLRVACAFLAPTETEWIKSLVEEHTAPENGSRGTIGVLLAGCAGPEEQDRISRSALDLGMLVSDDPGRRLIPTIAAQSGPALGTMLRGRNEGVFLGLLAHLPYDDVFIDLRNRAADRHVRATLREATDRFPARATRLLAAGADRRLIGDLLRGHVITHPDVAAGVLPGLTGAAADRVAAILDELGGRVDATTAPAWPAFPTKTPPVPELLLTAVLPPLLRDGTALPAAHLPALLTALALSRGGTPWGDLTADFDPDDLARYAWDVFFRWYYHGGGPKESWTLDALAIVGTDDTVRRLTPTILAWPGESGHARAVAALSVLAAIGTEAALMALNRIAQRSSFKGLKTAARATMDAVAAGLGLDGDQLADRLVPDLGLDRDGRTTIDYGPRAFTVGFDEKLAPYVSDADGRRLKALPKPGTRDDPERAPAAQKRFAELRKEARGIAADLVARLERDMVTGRRITGAELTAFYLAHPLVAHLARRLVWGVYDPDGTLTGAVRVAEDGTLTDDTDTPALLTGEASVGVAHPVHLGDRAGRFGELFADYEIMQPFPQLGREIYRLSAAEAAGADLARLTGKGAPGGALIGLEKRGWLRGAPEDAGSINRIGRALPGGGEVTVKLNPGMFFDEPGEHQTFDRITVGGPTRRLGEVDPVLMSEIIRDLTLVAED
jgi:hypothetical protein